MCEKFELEVQMMMSLGKSWRILPWSRIGALCGFTFRLVIEHPRGYYIFGLCFLSIICICVAVGGGVGHAKFPSSIASSGTIYIQLAKFAT